MDRDSPMQSVAPKVFISHASEDKERFVLSFAEGLRQNGIDAWLDKWEMLAGDSLVDKIFEEGLKNASAVIVVISNVSVTKPWVREELNVSLVNRIQRGCKLIPVVIDECEIPECLRSTVWERIHDLNSYEDSLNRILAAIFGHRDKPEVGQPPAYTAEQVIAISDLTKIDNLVLKRSCENAMDHGDLLINSEKVFVDQSGEWLVPISELSDSLEVLDHRGLVKLHRTIGVKVYAFMITIFGFEQYAQAYLPNYSDHQREIMRLISLGDVSDNQQLVNKLGISQVIVDHVLELLESNNLIQQGKCIGRYTHIYNISPEMRRMLEQQQTK